MAELHTDAQALSEAATTFDRISSDLKSAIGQVDSTAGDLAGALSGPAGDAASMADTEKGVTGMFASTGDTDAAGLLDEGGQCVQKLAGIWGGSGSDAYQQTQARWDSTAAELNAALKDLSDKVGQAGSQDDDGFDFKAMESGEAASADTTDQDFALVIYNANHACVGDACNGGNAGILFGDGGDGLNFDGKFLMARDLIRDQGIVVDAGFDLI